MSLQGNQLADIARFLKEAERCLRLAAKANDPVEKQALLRMADEWLMLARAASK